jgi:hypothetical protein
VIRHGTAFALVLALWFTAISTGCQRTGAMVWTDTRDGFEQSYFRGPNGPVYIKRKLLNDGCIFGDFPDDQAPTEMKVARGATWTGSYGHGLLCNCLDGGSRNTSFPEPHR